MRKPAATGTATPDWINVTDSPYDADSTPAGAVAYLPTGDFLRGLDAHDSITR